MIQGAMSFLIVFPFVIALILWFMKRPSPFRRYLMYVSAAILAGVAIALCINFFANKEIRMDFVFSAHLVDQLMIAGEIIICLIITVASIKAKRYYIALMAVAQTGLIAWLELSGKVGALSVEANLMLDNFSVLMTMIVGIIGSLICIYAVKYMATYVRHHDALQDRRWFFFSLLFLFIGAMFGIIYSNNLIWMFFFWEITSLVSYLLIGYTKEEEAENNAFRALWMNTLGGLGFAVGIAFCVLNLEVHTMSELVTMAKLSPELTVIPISLIAFAAMTKSAQMPFSTWLLGAMVAPTPTSALLHSTTMVKAGVYVLLRLAPGMDGTIPGTMMLLIGGFTFLSTSILAISQTDGKKLLAYSTISNLGLIVACAGVGKPVSVWAGILLLMFHAVSKSLLFLTVGAIEHSLGSRDVENMHGLIVKLPNLATILMTGISAMFLAPFGMLIAKWASLHAFVETRSLLLVIFVCFGSATTLFYWAKWLGKVVSVVNRTERLVDQTKTGEKTVLAVLTGLLIVLCLGFPAISNRIIFPFLVLNFGSQIPPLFTQQSLLVVGVLMILVSAFPFVVRLLVHRRRDRGNKDDALTIMGGVNCGDNRHFINADGQAQRLHMANWYLDDLCGERKLLKPSLVIGAIITIICLVGSIGGGIFL